MSEVALATREIRTPLRDLRQDQLLTQAQLARKANVSLRTIYAIEKGMPQLPAPIPATETELYRVSVLVEALRPLARMAYRRKYAGLGSELQEAAIAARKLVDEWDAQHEGVPR